jgi:uncharacterized membrane protein
MTTRLERMVGTVLRAGMVVSSGCLAAGLVLTLSAKAAAANLFLELGIVVLLATPAARVLVSVADYARQRDWTFTFLTFIVLAEMTAGALAALLFNR